MSDFFNPQPKIKAIRDAGYINYIKTLPCFFKSPWCSGKIDPAHINLLLPFSTKGMGIKEHDLCCIPACRYHHKKLDEYIIRIPPDQLLWHILKLWINYKPQILSNIISLGIINWKEIKKR